MLSRVLINTNNSNANDSMLVANPNANANLGSINPQEESEKQKLQEFLQKPESLLELERRLKERHHRGRDPQMYKPPVSCLDPTFGCDKKPPNSEGKGIWCTII